MSATPHCTWLLLAACAAVPAPPDPRPAPRRELPFRLEGPALDERARAELEAVLTRGAETVEAFFGRPFPEPFTVTVYPDRAALDASFPPEWGLGKSECWMVASGVAEGVRLLDPRTWKSEACEHDPDDAGHVERLLAHELVHVFHGQHNPSPDFVDVVGIDWFVEGLATLASGQLANEHASALGEAVASGALPAELATAWRGRYRYAVAGSLAAFLEHELGRGPLLALLPASSQEELLAAIGLEEPALLERWRGSLSP